MEVDKIDAMPEASHIFLERSIVIPVLEHVWQNDSKEIRTYYDQYPAAFQHPGCTDIMRQCSIAAATPLQLAVCILNVEVIRILRKILPKQMFKEQISRWFNICRYPYYDISCARRPSHLSDMDDFGGIDEIGEEHRKVENLLNGVVVMPQYNSVSKLDCDQTPLCGEKLVTFDNVRRVATSKVALSSLDDEMDDDQMPFGDIVSFLHGDKLS